MNTYIIYKGIKQRLSAVAPVFYYIGQYLKGKDNTSYKVPAIYIEMPKQLPISYFGTQQAARNTQIKVHILSNAPYKNHDTGVQDNSLNDHQQLITQVEQLLAGWALRREDGKLLTQQLCYREANQHNFDGVKVYSVLTFKTEFYS